MKTKNYVYLSVIIFLALNSCSVESPELIDSTNKSLLDSTFYNSLKEPSHGTFIFSSQINLPKNPNSEIKRQYSFQGAVSDFLDQSNAIDRGVFNMGEYSIEPTSTSKGYVYEIDESVLHSQIYSVLYGATNTYNLIDENAIFSEDIYVPLEITLTQPLELNDDGINITSISSEDNITWNTDGLNNRGVVIRVSDSNQNYEKLYLTEDDGVLPASHIIKDLPNDSKYILLTIIRGNGFFVTGSDEKSYKVIIMSASEISCKIK